MKRSLCKSCGGFMKAWMSTWLLSSRISGRWRLANESESNSKRYLSFLSGRTGNSWYWPYSPQSPHKIVSHLNVSYPTLWVPPPQRRCVIRVLFIVHIHIWLLMPETSSPSITSSAFRWGTMPTVSLYWFCLARIWDYVVSMHQIHIQDRRHRFLL